MLDSHSIRPEDSQASTDSTPDTRRYQNRTVGVASIIRRAAPAALVASPPPQVSSSMLSLYRCRVRLRRIERTAGRYRGCSMPEESLIAQRYQLLTEVGRGGMGT